MITELIYETYSEASYEIVPVFAKVGENECIQIIIDDGQGILTAHIDYDDGSAVTTTRLIRWKTV